VTASGAIAQRFWIWTAAVALLLLLFAFNVAPGLQFETNILALLPRAGGDPDAERALDRFADQLGRDTVFLIGAADFDAARRAALDFAVRLRASPAFSQVTLELDPDWPQRTADAYLPYRDGLLSARMRGWLSNGEDAALLAQARQALYTPAAFMRRSGAGADPLDLFGDFLAQTTPATAALTLRDGVLTVAAAPPSTMQYVLVRGVLAADAFSTAEEDAAGPALDAAFAAAHAAGAEVSGSGLIQHAVAASRLGQHEVKLFGSVQLLGLIGVLLWVFRSGRVLLLSAAALALGIVAALTVCHFLFGRVHVLTLVFCSNLAGIAIDYSIYYCADQFRTPGRWRAADALPFIGPAIGMSCLVSLMSYALLAVAPFPGLRQIAVFCCIGLLGAYVCVIAWFPRTVQPAPPAAAARLNAWFDRAQLLRERIAAARTRWFWLALLLATAIGLWRLQTADDVRVLQPETPQLTLQEQAVRDRLGAIADSRFLLVRAASAEALLQAEEQLSPRLDALIGQGRLKSYNAVSLALPSAQRQAQNRQLLAQRVFNGGGLLPRFMHELGFTPEAIAQRIAAFAQDGPPLDTETWLRSPAAEPYRHLWLGDIGGGVYAGVVTLSGSGDPAVLRAAVEGMPQVRLIDRVAEVSSVLRRYRGIALWIVAASVFASALLLAVPYGAARGVRLMAAPVAAVLAVLGTLGLLGVPLTFFHVVALHLVLGLSMEYAILLQLPELRGPSTLLSVTLAALLALIAFGLLAFSTTPFIHSIGLTVSIGVVIGFACSTVLGTIGAKPRGAVAS
jgi:predicted exporter